MKKLLVLLYMLIIVTHTLPAGENPFLPLLNRPYGERARVMHQWRIKLDQLMTQPEADTLMMYIRQAADSSADVRWKLEARHMEITYRFRQKTRLEPQTTYNIDSAMADYDVLNRQALAAGDTLIYLRAQRDIMNAYYSFIKNYARAFDLAQWLYAKLAPIPVDTLPDKLLAYNDIASMYYNFRDYDETREILNAIAAEPEMAHRLHLLRNVYNTLGLIYYRHDNDVVTAENYFRKILDLPPESNEPLNFIPAWEGIAKGNIGRMYASADRLDEAIPFLEFACQRMVEVEDYSFAAGMATLLADCYLKKATESNGQTYMQQAYHYIQLACQYNSQAYPGRQHDGLYKTMARYYTLNGNSTLAVAYMDSAENAREAHDREFNALELKRAQQRKYQQEQRAKDNELWAEQSRSTRLWHILAVIAACLAITAILLAVSIIRYRRKRRDYRALIEKTQDWAKNEETQVVTPLPKEEKLMQRIRQLLEEERAFTNPNLTLVDVSNQLKLNRTYISAAINHCTGQTFSNYVAQLRVREAVRIMSDPANANLTIDAIAFDSGFNDRKGFHRVFKRITGLAPSTFRANEGG